MVVLETAKHRELTQARIATLSNWTFDPQAKDNIRVSWGFHYFQCDGRSFALTSSFIFQNTCVSGLVLFQNIEQVICRAQGFPFYGEDDAPDLNFSFWTNQCAAKSCPACRTIRSNPTDHQAFDTTSWQDLFRNKADPQGRKNNFSLLDQLRDK